MGWLADLRNGGVNTASSEKNRPPGSVGDPFARDEDDSRTPSPSRDLYKAFHEAAHAWAFVSGGFDVLRIELTGSGGAVYFAPFVKQDLSAAQVRSLLVAVVAGNEGGIHYWTRHQGYSLNEALAEVHGDDSGDRDVFAEYAGGTGLTWDNLRDEAGHLIRVHGHGITATANKLVVARCMRSIVA